MHRRTLGFVALTLAVAAALASIGLRGDPGLRDSPDEAGRAREAQSGAGEPSLHGSPRVEDPADRTEAAREASVPAPARATRLLGRVSHRGTPVAARVEMRRIPEELSGPGKGSLPELYRAIADLSSGRTRPDVVVDGGPDGRFEATDLEPGTYALTAFATQGSGEAQVVLAPGESATVELRVAPRQEALEGLVRYADGRAWTGYVAVLNSFDSLRDGTLFSPRIVETDREGRFVVRDLPDGEILVGALGRDRTWVAGRPVTLPTRDVYTLTVDANTIAVKGRVVRGEDDAPVAGAEVLGKTSWQADGSPASRATTDAEGRFEVLVPSQQGAVVVLAAGFARAAVAVASGATDVEVRLGRTSRIRGQVKSATDQKPVSGIHVTLNPKESAGAYVRLGTPSREAKTITDADGRYEFADVFPGSYLVLARGRGFVAESFTAPGPPWPTEVQVAAGSDTVLHVRVVPGWRVVGRVTASDGAALAGARASLRASRSPPSRWDLYLSSRPAWGDDDEPELTDDNGEFRFDSLVPGLPYEVSVKVAGAPSPAPREVVAAVAGTEVRLDFRSPRPRHVDVTVLDRDSGAPVSGAVVWVELSHERVGSAFGTRIAPTGAETQGFTDASGRVRIGPFGEGQAQVSAAAEGYATASEDALPGAGGAGGLVATLRLAKGLTVAGRVLLPDGSPAAGTQVSLELRVRGAVGSSLGMRTAADGTFRFTNVDSGEYRVTATRTSPIEYEGSADVTAGEGSVEVRLGPRAESPRRLILKVRDPAGSPIPSAEASYAAGSSRHSTSVVEGRAEFELFEDESAAGEEGVLEVEFARDRNGTLLPLGRVRMAGVRGGRTVEVMLPPERTIEGHVLGPDGRGVANARVRADPVDPPRSDDPVHDDARLWRRADDALTDDAGAYRVGHLGDGGHQVFVLPPAEFAAPEPIRATAGDSSVSFRLKRARTAVVAVVGPDGAALPGARVVIAPVGDGPNDQTVSNLFASYGSGTEVLADGDGRARLPRLDSEALYVLGVRGPLDRPDFGRHIERRWSPSDVAIRLARGLSVAGVVRDTAGAPLAHVNVSTWDQQGVFTSTSTDEEGKFRFAELESGSLWLDAGLYEEGKTRAHLRKLVQAGDENLELVLDVRSDRTKDPDRR